MKPIDKGSYGKIYLGKTATGHYYAIKMLEKIKLIEDNIIKYAKFEIEVMKNLDHPNLLKICYSIKRENEIFLVLPFSEGGDLNKLFKKKIVKEENSPLPE